MATKTTPKPGAKSAPKPDPSRRGRPPALSRRGRWLGAAALTLVVLGLVADRADVSGLGLGLVALLFFVVIGQYPSAIFIWRRHVELAWRVERPSGDGILCPGRSLTLSIELRNRAPRGLGIATVRPIASPGLTVESVRVRVLAHSDARAKTFVVPRAVGLSMLHGASFELSDPLGLTTIEAYFPSPISLAIVPRLAGPLLAPSAARASGPERPQRSAARLAGQGGELRELRDHRPGDPWKQIAWKATARRGRLTVREVERETQSAHLIVLDASGWMRDGRPGHTPLDVAVELAARYARTALDGGDQVGLAIVDGRVLTAVPVSDRPGQRRFVTEALSSAASYDEDATELSDADLCATVGRYLLMQEGEDTRVSPPPVDDPIWTRLIAAPNGELYELSRLVAAVWASRERTRGASAKPARLPRAADVNMAELRAFCRDRAIALPPRLERGRGVRGVVAALQTLRRGRAPDRVLCLCGLDGLDDADGPNAQKLLPQLQEALTRLRRRGTRPLVVVPFAPGAAPPPPGEALDPIDELIAIERARRAIELAALGRRLGSPVRVCSDALSFRWTHADGAGRKLTRRAA